MRPSGPMATPYADESPPLVAVKLVPVIAHVCSKYQLSWGVWANVDCHMPGKSNPKSSPAHFLKSVILFIIHFFYLQIAHKSISLIISCCLKGLLKSIKTEKSHLSSCFTVIPHKTHKAIYNKGFMTVSNAKGRSALVKALPPFRQL